MANTKQPEKIEPKPRKVRRPVPLEVKNRDPKNLVTR